MTKGTFIITDPDTNRYAIISVDRNGSDMLDTFLPQLQKTPNCASHLVYPTIEDFVYEYGKARHFDCNFLITNGTNWDLNPSYKAFGDLLSTQRSVGDWRLPCDDEEYCRAYVEGEDNFGENALFIYLFLATKCY